VDANNHTGHDGDRAESFYLLDVVLWRFMWLKRDPKGPRDVLDVPGMWPMKISVDRDVG